MNEKLYPNRSTDSGNREIINKEVREVSNLCFSINNINLFSRFYEDEFKQVQREILNSRNLMKF